MSVVRCLLPFGHEPLPGPSLAELLEGLLAQKFVRKAEDDAVFKIELFARQVDYVQEPPLRILFRTRMADLLESFADGAVLVLDLLQLAHLVEARLETVEEQLIFEVGVGPERGFK